jgi:hypothetical protein
VRTLWNVNLTTGELEPHMDYDEEIFRDVEAEMADKLNGSIVDLYRALEFLYPDIPLVDLRTRILDMSSKGEYQRLLRRLEVIGPNLETILRTRMSYNKPALVV